MIEWISSAWGHLVSRPTDLPGWWVASVVGGSLAILLTLLLAQAFLMYFDRKVWAAVQMRKGPNVVGPFGLLQPLADGLKLFLKETVIPASSNRVVFILAPMVTFILALVAWAVIPFDEGLVLAEAVAGGRGGRGAEASRQLAPRREGEGVERRLCVLGTGQALDRAIEADIA